MYGFLQLIDTEKEVEEFWNTHINNIKEWYYIKQRDDDLIISASPEFLLKPICKKLNIKHLIASQVSPIDGKYTGINCHGKEKVRLFREQFDCEIDNFYSDSYSDTPLAEISKNAFMVKGDEIKEWVFK
jgi:phosphoserine phosphatase